MRKMKDSGIEWIGDIPENWNVGKTLFALSMPITDGPHETPELLEEGIPFVSAEAVSCGNGKIDFEHIRGFISQEYYEECCKKYTPQINDIYMIKSGATTGKVALVDTDEIFTIWSPLAVFRCDDKKCFYKYLFYVLQSDYYQKQVENKWSFGTQQNIGMRTLEKLLICYPPVKEQVKIANYLDNKCVEIDALIEAKEKTNALLKEQRQSIIYEAVTKGLNPNVPMKDSGIEWIGDVPETWDVKKIKYCFDLVAGATPKSSNSEYWDGNIVWITPADYKTEDVFIEKGHKNITDEGMQSCATTLIPENCIIFSKRAPVGLVAINRVPLCTNQGCISCIPHNDISSKFYYYVMSVFEEQFELFASGTTFKEISADSFANFLLPNTTFDEQVEIVNYLDKKCAELDTIIKSNRTIIEKLKEYRKSIIFEAVTGKVEV